MDRSGTKWIKLEEMDRIRKNEPKYYAGVT